MFKKSRRKIIASIMGILVLLFLGTLAIIYGSSYYEVYTRNDEMLVNYADRYQLNETEDAGQAASDANVGQDGQTPPDIPGQNNPQQEPGQTDPSQGNSGLNDPPGQRSQEQRREAAFQLSTFYSVAFSTDGEVLRIDNEENTGGYSDEDLIALAEEVLSGPKSSGVKWNLLYLVREKPDYTLVAFMNNTIMQESMTTLVRYTLVFGAVAIILFFFLSIHLARRIVEPLEESYTRQRQFISDAGHELKTPVAVITANLEILERETGKSQWISNIQYETRRMSGLISQLLELARTENVRVETEVLDFSHLVCGEVLPFESVAFEQGTAFTYEMEEQLFVDGNSAQLRQLTSILLDNGIRHCTAGGTVSLTLQKSHSDAVLSVSNTGKAIPKEQQAHLFERFYRADEARIDDANHYGLGLAIAKAVVTEHKGRIGVHCGEGQVTFTVHLPLVKQASDGKRSE